MAGTVLTARERPGTTWVKPSRRGGTLVFEERFVDYADASTGEPVVTSRIVTVTRAPATEKG